MEKNMFPRIVGVLCIIIVVCGIIASACITSMGVPSIQPIVKTFGKMGEISIEKVTHQYTLTSEQISGIEYVNLNISVGTGGASLNFSSDDIIYDVKFNVEENKEAPNVSYERDDNKLTLNVFLEDGEFVVTLGTNYVYNGSLSIGAGGFRAVLSNESNIDNLSVKIRYAGGIMVKVLDGANFNDLDLEVNTGGIIFDAEVNSLERNSTVSLKNVVGGSIVNIKAGGNVGNRIEGEIDIGSFNLDTAGYIVTEQTPKRFDMKTSNYDIALKKLDVDVHIGLGGGLVNQYMFFKPPI